MSVYVLVAIVRTRLRLGASLYETLQILSLTMFETTPWINCLCHIHRMQFRQIHRVSLICSKVNRTLLVLSNQKGTPAAPSCQRKFS